MLLRAPIPEREGPPPPSGPSSHHPQPHSVSTHLGGALAVLAGLGCAAGQAQPGFTVAALALALKAVQAELAFLLRGQPVSPGPPWSLLYVPRPSPHCR